MKLNGISYKDQLSPAMQITDQAEADQYFELLVAYQMGALVVDHEEGYCNIKDLREEAESNVRENLGYYAGYYDSETMSRVNKLFRTTHPIFGG